MKFPLKRQAVLLSTTGLFALAVAAGLYLRSRMNSRGYDPGPYPVASASVKSPNPPAQSFDPSRWVLTFSDDFEDGDLDESKWTPADPWGVVSNNELQGYVAEAFQLRDGFLKIRCSRAPSFYDGANRAYASGMMTTSGKFSQQYGRFEIRCKVPRGKGLWPAFWMLPDPPSWPPEIDVLEILCHEPNKVYMTNHWPHPDRPREESKSITGEFKGPDFSRSFHTFSVEWEKEEIRWYVDGIQRHRSDSEIPDVPMFLLVNLAVGGWAETPDANTVFPAFFEIDYVKAWQKKP